MAILKVWSPGGWSKNGDVKEGQREPDDQGRALWYRTLPAYVAAAAIWMALLGLLYLYFVLSAPKELKRRIEQEERFAPTRDGSHSLFQRGASEVWDRGKPWEPCGCL